MTKNVTDITLVTTTALNQCRKINPSNPQAVADQIEAMYKALKEIADFTMYARPCSIAKAVLNAIGKGE